MYSKIYYVIAALLLAGQALAGSGDPVFSWDTVPVYLHFGSAARMTDEQIEITARISNFICLEKAHGQSTDKEHPERIAGEDAQRIKKANTDAKVLLYWNTLIAWPFTSYNRNFSETHPKDWVLRDMEPKSTCAVLLAHNPPDCLEPLLQRYAGPLKDSACRYGCLTPTAPAHPQPAFRSPRSLS